MVNSEQFTKRLHKIMEYHDLSAASFADKIDVGRSSISHLLSGRNKPSLDFVMKIVHAFPDVELYWLLNGKGSFPKKGNEAPSSDSSPSVANTLDGPTRDRFSEEAKAKASEASIGHNPKKEIKKIVIFYGDGSFEAFEN